MHIEVIGLSADTALSSVRELVNSWSAAKKPINFVAMHHRENAVPAALWDELSETSSALHAASSCQGIMHNDGLSDIGLFVLSDPDGDYGTACMPLGDDTYAAAKAATEQALSRADREGEAPDLIWISITPGTEEDAVRAIQDTVGNSIPIIGGSAADDQVAGGWTVSDGVRSEQAGVVISALFCSTPLHFAYQNGYEPTQNTGTVTKTDGRRVFEIDARPAATVYQEWTGGSVPISQGAEDINILSEATLWPLGRKIGTLGDVPQFLLAHPCGANADGSIDLFAVVEEGEEITQMSGDETALAARAGRVADFALKAGGISADDVAGALVVYCGGCMLAVQSRIDEVYKGVDVSLAQRPFLGVFTFGEQGAMHDVGNRHGNLMVSCIAFSKGD